MLAGALKLIAPAADSAMPPPVAAKDNEDVVLMDRALVEERLAAVSEAADKEETALMLSAVSPPVTESEDAFSENALMPVIQRKSKHPN